MGPAPIPLDLHNSANGCHNPHLDPTDRTNEECGIREVWAVNLEDEFRAICQVSILDVIYISVMVINSTKHLNKVYV